MTSKPSKSTINYAAKEAYRLFATTGLKHSVNAGLGCDYFYSKTLDTEYIIVDTLNADERLVPVLVKESWKY